MAAAPRVPAGARATPPRRSLSARLRGRRRRCSPTAASSRPRSACSGTAKRSSRSTRAISRTPTPSTTTARTSRSSPAVRPRPVALVIDRHPEYLGQARARRAARRRSARRGAAPPRPRRRLPRRERPSPAIARRCSAWCSTGSASATTARSGAASSSSPTTARERLGPFKPVAMLAGDAGGARALAQPLRPPHGGDGLAEPSSPTPSSAPRRPRAPAARDNGRNEPQQFNAPLASSCGRLFDAVAAALNLCRDRQAYEGEAGARLEAIVDREAMLGDHEEAAYPFSIPNMRVSGLPYIEPLPMWRAICDLILGRRRR